MEALDDRNARGSTALHLAVGAGNLAFAAALLEAGAGIQMLNKC